jgi:L-alanine-DL-glutamate epimerase-like enolase superfamily enzyme
VKITAIRTTPLYCKFKQPYHWAKATKDGAQIVLVEIETDAGITGIGESAASATAEPILALQKHVIPGLVGQSVYDGNRLIAECADTGYSSSAPRYFAQAVAGIELALWDAIGKAAGQPLHRLLGGAMRDKVQYFGFVQGDTPKELAAHAGRLAKQGYPMIYVKIGRGDELDMEIVQSVRRAIGDRRLRLDANEAWDMLTARCMFERLKGFNIEFIEQPMPARAGAAALAQLRAVTDIPIAADQAVFSPDEVYDVCRSGAADVITLGLHETGGVGRFRKAAAVAEAAGLNVCLHGVFETGITTCASNQVAASIGNMDDGNQIMWQLLKEDIVESPSLVPINGALPISDKPGLGFELDRDAIGRAAEAYRKQR